METLRKASLLINSKEERITQRTRIGDKICSLHHVAGRGRKPLQSATGQRSLQRRSIHLSLRLQSNRVGGSFEGPAHRIANPIPCTPGKPAERHRGEGLQIAELLTKATSCPGFTVRLMSLSTAVCGRPGYRKLTPRNSMCPFRVGKARPAPTEASLYSGYGQPIKCHISLIMSQLTFFCL